jgi:magnesium transporter
MLSSTITGLLTMHYEAVLSANLLLVAFIPMLTDTGGNCGSQSATLIIRGMALDEIHIRDFFIVVWKEIRVSCLVGVMLATINFVRIYFQYEHDWRMAAVVALTLIAVVAMSKLLGCMLPMLAARIKIDPAMMAAPLITTIVDAGALVVYFNIAIKLLPM